MCLHSKGYIFALSFQQQQQQQLEWFLSFVWHF